MLQDAGTVLLKHLKASQGAQTILTLSKEALVNTHPPRPITAHSK